VFSALAQNLQLVGTNFAGFALGLHSNQYETTQKTSYSRTLIRIFRLIEGVPLTKSDIFRQKSDMKRTFFEQTSPLFAQEPPFSDEY
jgi:hypothetical protein